MNKNFQEKYQLIEKKTEKEIEEIYGEDFNNLLGNLLFNRGIKKVDDVKKFLYPDWEDNFDPFLFNDMKKTVNRIFSAIQKKENILIFSDYDTDGIPGGAILYKFFEKIKYKFFQNYIPNRNKDGYGLSMKKAEKIIDGSIFENSEFGNFSEKIKNGKEKFTPTLVITIDCGISDVKSAELLKKKNIDLIITDHHIVGEKKPNAFAILNHKIDGEKYPDKNLCGAGIIFKVIQALMKELLENKDYINILDEIGVDNLKEGWEKWLLDLVSISTVCDMVPLLGENRVFVKYGKRVFVKTQNVGLNKIIEKSKIDKKNISAEDLGFMIGPRINAASRLADPFFAFEALSKNDEGGKDSAEYLETLNNNRKSLTAKIMKEVWGKLLERELNDVIVIGNKEWPLGILGLVAGKISEKYKKPAFTWSQAEGEENNILKGSCRSDGKFSVHSLMKNSSENFIHFGGHSASGGFEIEEEKIHFLERELSENLENSDLIEERKIIIDSEIILDDVNLENYNEIEKMAPFGIGNQKPYFLLKNIEIFEVKKFGKNKEHLELIFKNSKNFSIKATTFYFTDIFEGVEFLKGNKINLLASFEMNRWGGNQSLRLKIEDIL